MSSFLISTRRRCPSVQHLGYAVSLVSPEKSRGRGPAQSHCVSSLQQTYSFRSLSSSWYSASKDNTTTSSRTTWSEEWKSLGLGASFIEDDSLPLTNLLFVQMGFGVDQHGSNDATKAAVRAVRNAIEFNSIPGVIEVIPGGRQEMLIHVKLGIPVVEESSSAPMPCDLMEVAKVFPYGKLLPMQVVVGGLTFPTGRVVEELGDTDDMAVCVAACVSIGYNNGTQRDSHATYSTKDGY